jgi:hypothetical protein
MVCNTNIDHRNGHAGAESGMIDTERTPIDKWSLTSVGDELGADEAHVWRASLDPVVIYNPLGLTLA